MDDDLKQNLTASETWIRGFFMLLFVFMLVVARVVTGAVVVIQFLFTVFTGQTNENLRYFGASLASFIYQSLLFVTYNSDNKPFPFSSWPTPEVNSDFAAKMAETDAEVLHDSSETLESDSDANNGDSNNSDSRNNGPDEHEPRA